ERNIQLLEQAADARDAPGDGVLAKCLVHEVRVAIPQIRTQTGPWPKPNSSTNSAKLTATFLPAGQAATCTGSRGNAVTQSARPAPSSRRESEPRAAPLARRRAA